MSSMNNNALSMAELTDEDLTAITGAGDGNSFGNCGSCGFNNFSGCSSCGFSNSPYIMAYSNYSASNFSYSASVSLNYSHVNKSSYFSMYY